MKKEDNKKQKITSETISNWGRIGGLTTLKKHGKKHMQEIGKKGADARWGKKKK